EKLADEIGYPLVVRPSYVLGGRGMEIVYNKVELQRYMDAAVQVSNEAPVLLDRFLDDATEVDVDAVCDGEEVVIGGLMEHIEQAGVHSGDSACSLPPYHLSAELQEELRRETRKLARGLSVVGLMNVQFAVQGDDVFILEVNPRASRTIPFVAKATGRPLASIAARCMTGRSLADQGITGEVVPQYYAVKEAVFPFIKFRNVDPLLGPEMKSTGEVMGVGRTFGEAFAKAQLGAGVNLPREGRVFVSVREADKAGIPPVVERLVACGFDVVATGGTAEVLRAAGLECDVVNKVTEGRPHIVDMIKNDEIALIINTTDGKQAIADSYEIRREALMHKVTYTTTLAGADATAIAIHQNDPFDVNSMQRLHRELTQ
ncbi:MAG: ATP-grasp domain-containing protein, partial [Thiohalospira sp.]